MFNLFYLPRRPAITGWQGTSILQAAKEVSQPEDDEFPSLIETITERRKIVHVLRTVTASRQPVMISSPHLHNGIQTRLMPISPDSDYLRIRQVANYSAHHTLLADRHFNLLMEHKESPLLCSLRILDTTYDNGAPCYVASMPEWLMFPQMRATQRVKVPVSLELTLKYLFEKHESIEANIVDLSEDGVGLVIPHLPLRRIRIDEEWHKAMISGAGARIGPVDLSLRHVHHEAGTQHFGAMFINLAEPARQQLRRLSLRLQSRTAKKV
jgi:c-di-GMP-binding flagellar brake protein YcgR